ncbi:hypothetical protein CDAR_120391 [Caerostris darwini]|uniref:Uncharacterized protein n=1 Tax=Caerostris darwini TaxID=1538125 RepID=A0AAV4R8N8_9ARAC|nr:hypothetical protein CDAR_120391 [Caerostris darwini]
MTAVAFFCDKKSLVILMSKFLSLNREANPTPLQFLPTNPYVQSQPPPLHPSKTSLSNQSILHPPKTEQYIPGPPFEQNLKRFADPSSPLPYIPYPLHPMKDCPMDCSPSILQDRVIQVRANDAPRGRGFEMAAISPALKRIINVF